MNLTAVTLPVVMGLKLQQQAFTCTQKMWRWMHMIVCLMIFPLFSLAPVAQAATPFSVDPYALQFDGVNDFVRVPNFGTFTLCTRQKLKIGMEI